MFSFDNKELRILVVDDMMLSRNTAKRFMNEMGFKQIDMAEDGEIAFSAIEKANAEGKPYALVLSDWVMPKLDGMGLLKKVVSSGWSYVPPVILLTAEADAHQVAQALKEGVSGYCKKPLNMDMVKGALVSLSDRLKKKAA